MLSGIWKDPIWDCSSLSVYHESCEFWQSPTVYQSRELDDTDKDTRGRNFVPKAVSWMRRMARIGADSLDERTQLVLRSQFETVRSGLTPCSGRYHFWVTSSCLALRGIPRSHCAFVRQPVRSGPDRETYIANPPSSATSRRENFARHLRRWLVRKRAPRESPRDEDDAGTTSLRENLARTRREWKWSWRRRCPTALSSRRWKA